MTQSFTNSRIIVRDYLMQPRDQGHTQHILLYTIHQTTRSKKAGKIMCSFRLKNQAQLCHTRYLSHKADMNRAISTSTTCSYFKPVTALCLNNDNNSQPFLPFCCDLFQLPRELCTCRQCITEYCSLYCLK